MIAPGPAAGRARGRGYPGRLRRHEGCEWASERESNAVRRRIARADLGDTRPPGWVRLINATGGLLRRFAVRWPKLDPEAMMDEARRRTRAVRLRRRSFRQGLDVLVESFNVQDTAHAFGRIFFREYCTGLLVNRLKIQADLTRHSGHPRGAGRHGRCSSRDFPAAGRRSCTASCPRTPRAGPCRMWEAMEPSPPPERETYASDPRIARARQPGGTAEPPGAPPRRRRTSSMPRVPRKITPSTPTPSPPASSGSCSTCPTLSAG